MTKKVVLFVGLPGAGKTTLMMKAAKLIGKQYNEVHIFDDLSENFAMFEEFLNHVVDDAVIFIADPKLTAVSSYDTVLDNLKKWFGSAVEVAVVVFSNEPDLAKKNVHRRRDDGSDTRVVTDHTIERWSSIYNPVELGWLCINRGIPYLWVRTYDGTS